MTLPPDEVFEVRDTAPVPAAMAYTNILERAQQCWQRPDRRLDADSYTSRIGLARLSVTKLPGGVSPGVVLVVVEVSRQAVDGDERSRLVARSLVATRERMHDLQNLRVWAEGKKPPCAGSP
jgi:hypothetical protein